LIATQTVVNGLLAPPRRRAAAAVAIALLTSTAAFSDNSGGQGKKKFKIDFVKVADTTQGYSGFQTFPAINNHGEVAFVAADKDGEGVFKARSDGQPVTVIASAKENFAFFGNDVAINANGEVAFDANTPTNTHAILKGDGISRKVIADSLANGLGKIFMGSPSINANGTVAFFSLRSERGAPAGIFTGNGGPLTTLLNSSPTGFTGFGNVAINDSGTVVFRGILPGGNEGVFTLRGNQVDVVDTINHPEFFNFGEPVINSVGTVADAGFLSQTTEIFTGDARGINARSEPAGANAFANTEHPSINNHGAVAFFASPNPATNNPGGIFLEVSGGHSLIPVIRPGDKLFGSTAVAVDLGRFALNERFQMAFFYTLEDGRSGVGIASFDGEDEDGNSQGQTH